jgi:hypothetical protein
MNSFDKVERAYKRRYAPFERVYFEDITQEPGQYGRKTNLRLKKKKPN